MGRGTSVAALWRSLLGGSTRALWHQPIIGDAGARNRLAGICQRLDGCRALVIALAEERTLPEICLRAAECRLTPRDFVQLELPITPRSVPRVLGLPSGFLAPFSLQAPGSARVATPIVCFNLHQAAVNPRLGSRACKATGRAKVTLARAIKSGKISAARGPDGSYAIDPSELARVYPLTGEPANDMERSVPGNGPVSEPGVSPGEVVALHHPIAEQAETIRDLRARLDASEVERRHESEEHRRVQERLTALLTHRQAGSVPAVALRAPWWRRWR